ncbi:MAG TPA: DUF929 family protein [Blastococcus sp.]|jgi:hypothetical protein|nr:DUF929 family protein [Blastococcus sp.]
MTAKQTPSATSARRSSAGGGNRTGKNATAAQRRAAQKQAAAQRALAAERGQRRQWLLVGGAVLAVIAVVGVLVGIKLAATPANHSSAAQAGSASQQVTSAVSGVPPKVLDSVGAGSIVTPPTALTGAPLSAQGKPRVLYVGAEYCPYCAAERWALAAALSRFGTLSGLGEVSSSPTDVYPNTATLSFHGAGYTSTYLTLTAKEIEGTQRVGNSYAPLDKLDPADATLFENIGKGSFPFVDIGGKYAISGASYDPSVLQGKTQEQIAAALSDPNSPIGKAIDGTANVITAAVCRVTGNQPGNVCTSAGVTAAAKALPASG